MNKPKDTTTDRRLGVMFGLAYGDALGRKTEFMNAAQLDRLGSPFRVDVGINTPRQGIVTDDTQMSIAVARAATWPGRPIIHEQTDRFVTQFIRWRRDPASFDGRRAPGVTCVGAVNKLMLHPTQWLLATRPDSKGNGANMRVSPLALRTDWSWDDLGGAAQLQAAITHGHSTALAAAELTAVAVRMLLEGVAAPTEQLLEHLLAYAYDQRTKYRGDWLGSLWQVAPSKPSTLLTRAGRIPWWDDADGITTPAPKTRKTARSPQGFAQHGWDQMIDALLAIYEAPRNRQQDPCDVGGDGWIAEEALAVSLHTLLCFPGDPANALRRAAFTSGDSDSIASITGALAGAAYGLSAFPANWSGNLEYRGLLKHLTGQLTRH